MKFRFHLKSILPFISVLILAACGGGGGGGGGVEVTSAGGGYGATPANTAPVILGGYIHTQKVCCYFNDDNDFFSPEGVIAVFKVSASDAEGGSIVFSISGNDASKISISENDGSDEAIVSFVSTPDFENPVDANGDNIYSFNVSVSDGTLSSTQAFTITVTQDASAVNADAWNGVLVKDDRYTPYDKYGSSYNLIVGALPNVTDGFITNVLNIANKMLAENDVTDSVNRDLLLSNFNQYKAFQRVGKTNMSSYDPALNNGNWQWSASTGCDAQPYFRVFNPWRQQKRFDNECRYIKRWVPELENRSAKEIHALETHDDYYLPKITNLKISAEESKAMFKAAGS